MRFLSVLLLLLCTVGGLSAGFPNGFTEDSYVFHDGYWYDSNGVSHTRVRIDTPGYWNCGQYYGATYHYKYTPYTASAAPAYAPGWRDKLLEIAKERDKAEFENRKAAFDHAYYLQSIQALGLQGNFRIENYGAAAPLFAQSYGSYSSYGGYGSSVVNYGVNANTTYGYSTAASLYADSNLDTLFQQAAQLAGDAQTFGSQANTNFQALVGSEGRNRARVAEILARGQMAAQVLQALQAAPSTETRQFTFQIDPQGVIVPQSASVPDATKADIRQRWTALATSRCASCHSNGAKKGGFDINSYLSMNAAQKNSVWARLTTTDQARRMPKDGPALTADELRLFVLVDGGQANAAQPPVAQPRRDKPVP